MKRVFERKEGLRDDKAGEVVERIKIGVTGIGRGAGTSFVAVSLAYFAAQNSERKVAFVQLDGKSGCAACADGTAIRECKRKKTDVYDALGIDKRFAGREFADFSVLLAEGKSIRGIRNIDERINWALEVPGEMKAKREHTLTLNDKTGRAGGEYGLDDVFNGSTAIPETLNCMRLVNNIYGDFIVCDFGDGTGFGQERRALYEDMDVIICVIDPLPSRLLGASEHLSFVKMLELRGHRVFTVINKDNAGVNRRELRDFIGADGHAQAQEKQKTGHGKRYIIPMIDERLFYLCQYNCEIPASQSEIKGVIEPVFSGILKQITI